VAIAALGALLLLASCVTLVSRDDLAAEYLEVANTLYESGAFDAARTYYGRALELNPDLESASFNLARVHIEQERYERAIALLEELRRERPDSLELAEALAFALLKSGALDRAEELYQQILEESPYRTSVLFNLGVLARELERPWDAVDYLARAYEVAPDDADVAFAYASLLAERGRPEAAVPVFETFIDGADSGDERLKEVARIFEETEYYSRALSVYERVLDADSEDAQAQFRRARLLLTVAEDVEAGLSALEQALDLGYEDRGQLGLLVEDPALVAPADVEELLRSEDFELPALREAAEQARQEEAERRQAAAPPRRRPGRPYRQAITP
jgi:tetratricopeptide (TPR) repeat protein